MLRGAHRHGAARGDVAKDTVVRAQLRTICAVLTLVVVGAVPAMGAPAGPDAPEPDLATTRDELEGARRGVAELETAVRRTNDEVAALDERVRTASTELAQVRDQLSAAERAAAAATDAEREAAAALAAVDAQLATLSADFDEHRERLERRAVEAYKQGSILPHDLLVRGVSGASDWHEVTVTLETIGRLVRDDRELADGTVALTRDTAALRGEAGDARSHAVAAARQAAVETRRVEELAARHERALTTVATERDRRGEVLAVLEADTEARKVLVDQLERQVASLELAALAALVPAVVDLDAAGVVDLDAHGPPPPWAGRLPPAGRPYAAAIDATAARHGLDGRLLAALVWTESNFRPDAVSHAGALGLAQLMPGTARGLGVDPRDPMQNLDGGARYLRAQLDTFGRVDLALAAYNAGPGRVHAAGGVPNIVETQLYVVRVLERYEAIAGA
jgi:soluble lytic murein transglycosylase-like protein